MSDFKTRIKLKLEEKAEHLTEDVVIPALAIGGVTLTAAMLAMWNNLRINKNNIVDSVRFILKYEEDIKKLATKARKKNVISFKLEDRLDKLFDNFHDILDTIPEKDISNLNPFNLIKNKKLVNAIENIQEITDSIQKAMNQAEYK